MTPISSLTLTTGTGIERATRSAVRCRVPVSLVGNRGVGNEVHVGPGQPLAVRTEDDRAVHLGQLTEPLRAERRIEQEPAAADGQHVGTVAEDQQGASLGTHDAFDPITKRRARGDQRERLVQGVGGRPGRRHGGILLGAGPMQSHGQQSLGEGGGTDQGNAFDAIRRVGRNDGPGEPQPRRLGQST